MELKKGETIMIDAALHLPATFLHEAFSDRSGVPLDFFELYYRGKRLEGEAALAGWGVGRGSTIEVKMRGRGGMGYQEGKQPQVPEEDPPSPSKVHVEKKLQNAQDTGVEETQATKGVIELDGGLTFKPAQREAQASTARCPTRPVHRGCSDS